jgi:hypothetical protein
MSGRANLRAVSPGERPLRAPTVDQAAASGDHRALLVAMRDRIAVAVSDSSCPPRDLAALTRRLQDIASEIASMDARDSKEAGSSAEVGDGDFDSSAF